MDFCYNLSTESELNIDPRSLHRHIGEAVALASRAVAEAVTAEEGLLRAVPGGETAGPDDELMQELVVLLAPAAGVVRLLGTEPPTPPVAGTAVVDAEERVGEETDLEPFVEAAVDFVEEHLPQIARVSFELLRHTVLDDEEVAILSRADGDEVLRLYREKRAERGENPKGWID